MIKKENNKKIRAILFMIWVLIGIILILLPLLMGNKFEIESSKKFVYIYVIASFVFPQIVKRILNKIGKNKA